MPAGNYEISPAGDELAVRNLDTMEARLLIASIHVQASQFSEAPHAKLVFHKYDDQYFLAEIWNESDLGIQLPESKLEKELTWARNKLSARTRGHRNEVTVTRCGRKTLRWDLSGSFYFKKSSWIR